MSKAYYIDTYSTGHLHEIFDASSLLMFSHMYDHVEYRASRTSYEHVIGLLGELPKNVTYSPIRVANIFAGWSKAKGLLKQIQATIHNTAYIINAPEGCDIIFNYNTLAALPIMNIAARYTQNRILQICHGELTELKTGASKHIMLRQGVKLLQSSNNHVAENMYFAVLGKAIYENVCPLVGRDIQSRLMSFDHSTIFPNEENHGESSSGKLVIGTIGGLREGKGRSAFIELARHLKNMPNVELRCIGRVMMTPAELCELGVTVPEHACERYLTREELYEQIRQLDYALFLFQPDVYKLTASGSVFDAIACGVPILSLTNDYFEGLFESYGDFGYLEKDYDSLVQRIEWLAGQDAKRPQWNMSKLRKDISPHGIAERFREQWLP